jgi:hypothetical protein
MHPRHGAPLAVLALVALVACGQGPDDVLAETARNLADVHSGAISVRLVVQAADGSSGGVGFELQGPFQLPQPGQLPVARLTYTRLAGPQHDSVTYVGTGGHAYVEVEGVAYELPEEKVAGLRGTGPGGAGPLQTLAIDDWTVDPQLSDGGTIGGVATDRVHAGLDVVSALNGLLGLSAQVGTSSPGGLTPLSGGSASQLERAVRSATIDVYAGHDDHILRKLLIVVRFQVDAPEKVRQALGAVAGATVRFEMDLSSPNEPVDVAEPTEVRPYSELPLGG